MKIQTFKVEQWMNAYETKAKYNLGETCIDSLTVNQLLELCNEDKTAFFETLGQTRLSYGHIEGSPQLLEGIAGLYKNIESENIVVTHGAIGANHQLLMTLMEPSDNIVCVMPTYQQHYSIPQSIGAEVRPLQLCYENNFLPDIEKLEKLTDKHTKIITINNPNNPTGAWIPKEVLNEVVAIARKNNAYILSDEVYRGISENGVYMPSVVDLYEKGISVGSMSKIFSLAGLRLGWIATKCDEVKTACLERRDYDTISCGVLDDLLAAMALKNKEKIFKRNREILQKNRELLHNWVQQEPLVYYKKPVAGTTALVYYKSKMKSREFSVKLLEEKGVLVTPGECFEMEYCLRIGYAYDSQTLQTGLQKISELLQEIHTAV